MTISTLERDEIDAMKAFVSMIAALTIEDVDEEIDLDDDYLALVQLITRARELTQKKTVAS